MKEYMTFYINGGVYEDYVDHRRTLSEVLRDNFGFLGVHEGCSEGHCGACTVIINGEAVLSCQMLAVTAQKTEITTIEGLAEEGTLHPLQEAFIESGAVQCGFCTPGMIMSAKALLDKHPNPTEEQMKYALSGNLCRCTGYYQILEAVEIAAKKLREEEQ